MSDTSSGCATELVIYLVRHGTTAANRENVYAGRVDDELLAGADPDLGAVANYLATKNISSVTCSPQQRARDSAQVLASRLGVKAEECPAIAEMDMGPWTGLSGIEIAEKYPKEWKVWRRSPAAMAMDGFEGLPAVERRVTRWLQTAPAHFGDGAHAVYTHETVIRVLIGIVTGRGLSIYRCLSVSNCSVSSVGLWRGKWYLRSLNEFVP